MGVKQNLSGCVIFLFGFFLLFTYSSATSNRIVLEDFQQWRERRAYLIQPALELEAFRRELDESDDFSSEEDMSDVEFTSAAETNDSPASRRIKTEPPSPTLSAFLLLSPRSKMRSLAGLPVATSSRITLEALNASDVISNVSTSTEMERVTDDEDELKYPMSFQSACGYPSSPLRNVWRDASP